MQRKKCGFTLVELLVVITIIGMLIAILIPAVNMVREEGRKTTCMNNQSQVGMAILGYELNKRQLPGVMNALSYNGVIVQYSWAEAIFPYIERADMWDKVRTNQLSALVSSGGASGMNVAVLICPDDPNTVDPASPNAVAVLSYGVNDQFFLDNRPLENNPPTQPVDRNGTVQSRAVVSNLKTRPSYDGPNGTTNPNGRGWTVTTSQTVMLGDRTFADSNPISGTRASSWAATTGNVWTEFTFPWWPNTPPTTSPFQAQAQISPNIMCSTHGATSLININLNSASIKVAGTTVVLTYFDGHAQKVPSDTLYPLIQ